MITRSRSRLLAPLFAVCVLTPAFASGSYSTARPPKAKADQGMGMKLDHEKYGLGQKIYEGKVDLAPQGDAQGQEARLKVLESRIPADNGAKKNLTNLAGKLTPDQLEALEYFVDHRFAMKK